MFPKPATAMGVMVASLPPARMQSASPALRSRRASPIACALDAHAEIRIAPHFYSKAEEIELFFGELKKIRSGSGR